MKNIPDDVLSRLEDHLRDKRFFRPHQKILVACSGGPDSVALFHLLRTLAAKHFWQLGLIHFNHRLRPGAAKADESFVKRLARKFKVAFYGGAGDVQQKAHETKTSIEECARQMRYDFFLRTLKIQKIQTLALAHTRDDQAETVLMRVLQGTGLRGLQGIREKLRMRDATIIRPLLIFTKRELLSYLAKQKFSYRSDRTNDSSRFIRNRIRLKLIPGLQRDFNPKVVEALSRIPVITRDENELLAELEKKAWEKLYKKKRGNAVTFRRPDFLKCASALQFRLVERALKQIDRQSGLSFDAWHRLRREFFRLRYRCSLPRNIDCVLTSKKISFQKKEPRQLLAH